MKLTVRPASNRRGIASVWALVVIAVTSALICTAVLQLANARKQVDDERTRMQTRWLLRSGFELAADRLLANPEKYQGETVALLPGTEVKIHVEKPSTMDGAYRINCVAKSVDGSKAVVFSDHRLLKLEKTAKGTTAKLTLEGSD
jgi:hypothetical protein